MSGLTESLLASFREVDDVGVGRSEFAPLALSIAKGYAEGKWAFHLHVRLRTAGVEPKQHDLCSVFERCAGAEEFPNLEGEGSFTDVDGTDQIPDVGERIRRVEDAVLIPVPEVVEDVERVVLRRVPALVRLRSLDECPHIAANRNPFERAGRSSFLIPAEDVSNEVHLGGMDRERMVVLRRSPISLDQSADEMVQGRAEVVDDLAKNDAQPKRHRLEYLEAHDIAVRLRILLELDSIGVRVIPEGPPLAIEKYLLLVRPVELRSYAREV